MHTEGFHGVIITVVSEGRGGGVCWPCNGSESRGRAVAERGINDLADFAACSCVPGQKVAHGIVTLLYSLGRERVTFRARCAFDVMRLLKEDQTCMGTLVIP